MFLLPTYRPFITIPLTLLSVARHGLLAIPTLFALARAWLQQRDLFSRVADPVAKAIQTEVMEINRSGFTNLFQARPETAAGIAAIAAAREEETLARASSAVRPVATSRERQNRILETMRRIFDF